MGPNDYSLLLVLFYVPYGLFNIAWSIMAKIYSPSVIILFCVGLLGMLTMVTVASKKWSDIFACRFFIGLVEASYKPCEVYYLSLSTRGKSWGFMSRGLERWASLLALSVD